MADIKKLYDYELVRMAKTDLLYAKITVATASLLTSFMMFLNEIHVFECWWAWAYLFFFMGITQFYLLFYGQWPKKFLIVFSGIAQFVWWSFVLGIALFSNYKFFASDIAIAMAASWIFVCEGINREVIGARN